MVALANKAVIFALAAVTLALNPVSPIEFNSMLVFAAVMFARRPAMAELAAVTLALVDEILALIALGSNGCGAVLSSVRSAKRKTVPTLTAPTAAISPLVPMLPSTTKEPPTSSPSVTCRFATVPQL